MFNIINTSNIISLTLYPALSASVLDGWIICIRVYIFIFYWAKAPVDNCNNCIFKIFYF